MAEPVVPPLPAGFTLDTTPPLPPGFKLDAPGETAPPKEQTTSERLLSYFPTNPLIVGPARAALGLFNMAGGELNHAAYNAGGAATDLAAKVLPPETAAKVGFATNLGVQALPMFLGGAAGGTAAPELQATARNWMQSALKPSWEALRTGKAAQAIDTMLKEGLNVTPGGVAALKSKIADLNQQIVQAIQASTATVDKAKVASTLQGLLSRVEKQATPQGDMNAVTQAWDNFLNHPLLSGNQTMPIQLAQELKQGTYRALGNKSYGELKGADTEAQKTLARGLKDEIAAGAPEVSGLNAKESEMLNALSVTERRVLMDSNKNPMGLALLAHNPAAWAAFMADRSPLFKSLVARMLYSGSKQIPATAGRVVGAIPGAVSGAPENQ